MSNRRDFLKTLGISAASLAASEGANAKPVKRAGDKEKRPNIILLLTDQQRLSALGSYGATVCQTPNLDRLADEGVRFENAYTSCPLCSPARASIMTGLHIHAHRIGANINNFGCNLSQLPDGPDLLSRRLASAGYACGYTGKWHLGTCPKSLAGPVPPQYAMPSTRGFTGQNFPGHGGGGFRYPEYEAYLRELGCEHKVRPHKTDGEKIRHYGVLEGPVEASVPYFLAEHTIGMIDEFVSQDQPFFIWHNNWGPHEPYYVPQSYYDAYKDVEIPQWENYDWRPDNPHGPDQIKRHPSADRLHWEDWQESIRHYYAFATLIDEQFGRIFEHLKKRGIDDNTIIIFSSDHGETLGSHGGLVDKGWCHYEEIQHVGLIVKDPRQKKRGTVTELASLLDLYPTILEYAGAKSGAKKVHGRSLRPLVEGRETAWRDSVFVEFFGLGNLATNMVTCRHGQMKYGWTCSNKDELYDLENDPYEMDNLIDNPRYAQEVELMRRHIYTFMVESQYPGTSIFLSTRLGYSGERQHLHSPAPTPRKDFRVPMGW